MLIINLNQEDNPNLPNPRNYHEWRDSLLWPQLVIQEHPVWSTRRGNCLYLAKTPPMETSPLAKWQSCQDMSSHQVVAGKAHMYCCVDQQLWSAHFWYEQQGSVWQKLSHPSSCKTAYCWSLLWRRWWSWGIHWGRDCSRGSVWPDMSAWETRVDQCMICTVCGECTGIVKFCNPKISMTPKLEYFGNSFLFKQKKTNYNEFHS